jgi:hypothetical protein
VDVLAQFCCVAMHVWVVQWSGRMWMVVSCIGWRMSMVLWWTLVVVVELCLLCNDCCCSFGWQLLLVLGARCMALVGCEW